MSAPTDERRLLRPGCASPVRRLPEVIWPMTRPPDHLSEVIGAFVESPTTSRR